ncbi:MAG: hypothetical protein ACM3UZ_02110, partial [Acidobacteriota bacterium]
IAYTALWVGLGTALEFILIKTGFFVHLHGWNLWWSALFYCIMFPLLQLHYSKPLLVWPISFVLAFAVIYRFHPFIAGVSNLLRLWKPGVMAFLILGIVVLVELRKRRFNRMR